MEKIREFDSLALHNRKDAFQNIEEPFRQILIKKNREREEIDKKIADYQKRMKEKKLETPYSVEKLRKALIQNSKREISSVLNSYIMRERKTKRVENNQSADFNGERVNIICNFFDYITILDRKNLLER